MKKTVFLVVLAAVAVLVTSCVTTGYEYRLPVNYGHCYAHRSWHVITDDCVLPTGRFSAKTR